MLVLIGNLRESRSEFQTKRWTEIQKERQTDRDRKTDRERERAKGSAQYN